MGAGAEAEPPTGFVVLANPAARAVGERALGDIVSQLALRAPTSLRHTAGPDDIDDALRHLDGRRPVVVGGDGSLHLVVNRILALGLGHVPVALIPLGTGNDLARGIHLPLDPSAASEIACSGTSRTLPVIVRDGDPEVVVNNAHLGLGERAARLAVGLKPRLGALAYPVGGAAAGIDPEVHPLELRVDGATVHDGDVLAVVVVLGPSAGGGHQLVPDADPTEPVLDVLVVEAGPFRRRLAVAAAVIAHRDPATHPGVARWTGKSVEVLHHDRDQLAWDVDGEERTWSSPVRLSIRPHAWRLTI